MKISRDEAYFILKNIDMFVNHFEAQTNKKVTPGALQIINEILTDASFPDGGLIDTIH